MPSKVSDIRQQIQKRHSSISSKQQEISKRETEDQRIRKQMGRLTFQVKHPGVISQRKKYEHQLEQNLKKLQESRSQLEKSKKELETYKEEFEWALAQSRSPEAIPELREKAIKEQEAKARAYAIAEQQRHAVAIKQAKKFLAKGVPPQYVKGLIASYMRQILEMGRTESPSEAALFQAQLQAGTVEGTKELKKIMEEQKITQLYKPEIYFQEPFKDMPFKEKKEAIKDYSQIMKKVQKYGIGSISPGVYQKLVEAKIIKDTKEIEIPIPIKKTEEETKIITMGVSSNLLLKLKKLYEVTGGKDISLLYRQLFIYPKEVKAYEEKALAYQIMEKEYKTFTPELKEIAYPHVSTEYEKVSVEYEKIKTPPIKDITLFKQYEYSEKIVTKEIEKRFTQITGEKLLEPKQFELASKVVSPILLKHTPFKYFTSKPIQKLLTETKVPFLEATYPEISTAIMSSYYEEFKTKPILFTAKVGAFFVAPLVFKGVSSGAVLLSKKVTIISKGATASAKVFDIPFISKVVTATLPSVYLGLTTQKIMKVEPGYARAKVFGKVIASEITPMAMGGILSMKFMPKIEGYIRSFGRKEISVEKMVPKDVLEGKHIFPEAKVSAKVHKELFLIKSQRIPGIKDPTLYHATGKVFWTKTLKVGEEPGYLFGSYGVSPHFTRVSGYGKVYGGDLFQPFGTPGVAAIIPKKFVIPTKKVLAILKLTYIKPVGKPVFLDPGTAYVPGIKSEVEAILPALTEAKLISSKYFFAWKGVRVPIDVFKVVPTSKIDVASLTSTIKIEKILASYSMPSSPPISTPSSYALASILDISYSYPSKISSPIPPSSVLSYISPSKISKISSPKVSIPSILPPSKISYPPSIPPPSKISLPPYSPPKVPVSPPFIPPIIKTPIIPIIPPVLKLRIPTRKAKLKKKIKRSKAYIYAEDFTSKVLGFSMKIGKVAQLKKLLRTELTGLERRPAIAFPKKYGKRIKHSVLMDIKTPKIDISTPKIKLPKLNLNLKGGFR